MVFGVKIGTWYSQIEKLKKENQLAQLKPNRISLVRAQLGSAKIKHKEITQNLQRVFPVHMDKTYYIFFFGFFTPI